MLLYWEAVGKRQNHEKKGNIQKGNIEGMIARLKKKLNRVSTSSFFFLRTLFFFFFFLLLLLQISTILISLPIYLYTCIQNSVEICRRNLSVLASIFSHLFFFFRSWNCNNKKRGENLYVNNFLLIFIFIFFCQQLTKSK